MARPGVCNRTGRGPAGAARRPGPPSPILPARGPTPDLGCLFEVVETLVLTLVIFFVIQTFIAQPYQVQQTVDGADPGARAVRAGGQADARAATRTAAAISSCSTRPRRGPTTRRRSSSGSSACAGDTVEIQDDGIVYVNGVALDEPYTYKNDDGRRPSRPTRPADRPAGSCPPGELFVMGDHRQRSADSRVFGPIAIGNVIGRAFLRYWPISTFGRPRRRRPTPTSQPADVRRRAPRSQRRDARRSSLPRGRRSRPPARVAASAREPRFAALGLISRWSDRPTSRIPCRASSPSAPASSGPCSRATSSGSRSVVRPRRPRAGRSAGPGRSRSPSPRSPPAGWRPGRSRSRSARRSSRDRRPPAPRPRSSRARRCPARRSGPRSRWSRWGPRRSSWRATCSAWASGCCCWSRPPGSSATRSCRATIRRCELAFGIFEALAGAAVAAVVAASYRRALRPRAPGPADPTAGDPPSDPRRGPSATTRAGRRPVTLLVLVAIGAAGAAVSAWGLGRGGRPAEVGAAVGWLSLIAVLVLALAMEAPRVDSGQSAAGLAAFNGHLVPNDYLRLVVGLWALDAVLFVFIGWLIGGLEGLRGLLPATLAAIVGGTVAFAATDLALGSLAAGAVGLSALAVLLVGRDAVAAGARELRVAVGGTAVLVAVSAAAPATTALVFEAIGPADGGASVGAPATTEAAAMVGLFALAIALVVAIRLGAIPFHLRVPRLTDVVAADLAAAAAGLDPGAAGRGRDRDRRSAARAARPAARRRAGVDRRDRAADARRRRPGRLPLRRHPPRDRLPRDRRRRAGAARVRRTRSGGLGTDAGVAGRARGVEDGGRGVVGGDGGPVRRRARSRTSAGGFAARRSWAPACSSPRSRPTGCRDGSAFEARADLAELVRRRHRLARSPWPGWRPCRPTSGCSSSAPVRRPVASAARHRSACASAAPEALPVALEGPRPDHRPRPLRSRRGRRRSWPWPRAPGRAPVTDPRATRRPPWPRRRGAHTGRGSAIEPCLGGARRRPCGATGPSCWPRRCSPWRCSRPHVVGRAGHRRRRERGRADRVGSVDRLSPAHRRAPAWRT